MTTRWRPRPPCAFTLIELLLVIAIIALLIGIILPALDHAKRTAKMIAEQAALKQQELANASYNTDFKDKMLPSAPHWNWAHGAATNQHGMEPGDPLNPGDYLSGSICKIWPMHFLSATNFPHQQLQRDKLTWEEFWSRPHIGAGSDSYQTALAFHPSFGMNGVYVGGAYTHGAFRTGNPGPNTRMGGGDFYVTDVSKVKFTERLLVFLSSRGGDVKDGGWWNYGAQDPNLAPSTGKVRPGYFIVTPPKPHPRDRGGPTTAYTLGGGWSTIDKFDPRALPSTWGMLDVRHFGKATTVAFDGHVEMQTIPQLRDMTRWSNYARRVGNTPASDWNFEPAR